LWINFLQREAAAKEMPGDEITSPIAGSMGGSEPGSPAPMERK